MDKTEELRHACMDRLSLLGRLSRQDVDIYLEHLEAQVRELEVYIKFLEEDRDEHGRKLFGVRAELEAQVAKLKKQRGDYYYDNERGCYVDVIEEG